MLSEEAVEKFRASSLVVIRTGLKERLANLGHAPSLMYGDIL